MNIKIAIIEPVGGHGGMDYYNYGLSQGLAKNKVEVILYTSNQTKLRIYENVLTKYYFNNIWNRNFITKVSKYLYGHYLAIKDVKKEKIKIIHLHFFELRIIDYLIMKFARLNNLKIIATLHDIDTFNKKSNKYIEKKCINLIDGIIVHNKSSLKSLLIKQKINIPIKIIPHGNYLPFIEDISNKSKIDNNKLNLLFFGQIKKVKGLEILIKAIKILKNNNEKIELTIAGKAWKNDLKEYEDLIKELELTEIIKTNFKYIPDKEVSTYFANTDLVVLPYTRIYQSGVLLLALSYGKPVICSDLEPFKEIITHEKDGFIFKNESIEDLAEKISDIIKKNKLSNVTNNIYNEIREKYDWNIIGESTKKFYLNFIK